MLHRILGIAGIAFLMLQRETVPAQETADPYAWLESVDGEKALAWVREHNDATLAVLQQHPKFQQLYEKNLEVYNSSERIANPQIVGQYLYNFWQDAKSERGIWRRTTMTEYLKPQPKWEVVLDLDSLSKANGENWVFKGVNFLYPDYNLCMVSLSRGGGDAVVNREFDLRSRQFVTGGFYVPEAKGGLSWKDENTLIVSSDFGDGTLTRAGYPRIAKLWKRGTPLDKATAIFEGDSTDNGVWGYAIDTPERQYVIVLQGLTDQTSNLYSMENGGLVQLDIPKDATFQDIILRGQLIVWLKSDWNVNGSTFKQGSLVSVDYNGLLRGERNIEAIFTPTDKSSIRSVLHTKNLVLVSVLNNIRGELYEYSYLNGAWRQKKVGAPEYGTITLVDYDDASDQYFFSFTNFLIPTSLYWVSEKNREALMVKTLPEFFDAGPYSVTQHEARSKDGIVIPYFLIARKDLSRNGGNPVLLRGYGGFEIPMVPNYSATDGYAWLKNGGAVVLANIRGGGEFGPMWHKGAVKENRQKAYDDFIAVAEDLISSKVTSPEHLGIIGGSNGGLLVGAAFTQRPDLFGGVACWMPLLDMKRYSKLLAGASWMDEYGDPDKPEEWAYIKNYSPYQNVFPDRRYPEVFFLSTTRDDRVHPAHARKMAAKMEGLGYKVYYYEHIEGGHGAATNKQAALMNALQYVYFLQQLH
jgi:prolyl oligopeptidase